LELPTEYGVQKQWFSQLWKIAATGSKPFYAKGAFSRKLFHILAKKA
jgi:hypothetical protein